jgi:hypothetical protein
MKSRFDAALRILCSVPPAGFAALSSASAASAAHDVETVRTVGLGFTGAGRALDLLVSAPMQILPFGTHAGRAALASALVTGLCGAVGFDVVRALVATTPEALRKAGLRRSSGDVSPRLLAAVSAVAVLTALLSPAWQAEAAAPGGAVLGALLVLLALRAETLPFSALVLGLAASYEPLVFLAALAAIAPRYLEKRFERASLVHSACAFALGLVPLALGVAVARRAPEFALAAPMLSLVDRGNAISAAVFAHAEIGTLMLVACVGGAVLSLVSTASRALAIPLVLVVVVAGLALVLGSAAGPDRFAALILAGIACAYAIGATTLAAVVIAIASARVPFAEASAALVVVLELVLPVRAADESITRREAHAAHAASAWNDVAWGDLPPASVLLVSDRGTLRRIASARATGEMRADLLVVPTFDILGRQAERALLQEPKLAPLYRDFALGMAPEELSLANIGAERALVATFDPKWERALARHLVPIGLSSRFQAESRGVSERKKALDDFAPAKERLVRYTVVKKDADLAAATAVLLRSRAIAMAATGERDLLARALDDLRAFAADDPVGAKLVRRTITSKGAIEVQDLVP